MLPDKLTKYIDKLIEEEVGSTSVTGAGEAYSTPKSFEKEKLDESLSYRRFSETISRISPERKLHRALYEINKRVKEIEQMMEFSSRLKTESTLKKEDFWASKSTQLEGLSERFNQLSSKIRNLAQ